MGGFVIIFLSLLIDRWCGEPPLPLHPVVWMGRYLRRMGTRLPDRAPRTAFLLGSILWLSGAIIAGGLYGVAQALAARLSPWLYVLIASLLLKPLLALRMLLDEVRSVERALDRGLEDGRERLAHIVSRDTTHLDESEVRESALESLAENLSDSVIAPLFWFALLGLPGAAVYRFANTADAMWGYRGRWEWAGKFAARADDVLNWIPARLTALAILLAGTRRLHALRNLRREAALTSSPNSGWPMSALALSLAVRLRKPGVYTLNLDCASPTRTDTVAALEQAQIAAWGLAALLAACMMALGRFFHA
jgi:adenosylcobinamide-phosphate synthase